METKEQLGYLVRWIKKKEEVIQQEEFMNARQECIMMSSCS